jgi:Peptidase family M1 domain
MPIMHKNPLLFLCFLLVAILTATVANAQKAYFQQAVTYKIDVTLNDNDHVLDANMRMTYQNNAPETLDYLYIHLWPNAYSSINTAFAKQKEQSGDLSFYFSKEEEKGDIQGLDFSVDGKKAVLEIDTLNPDIAILRLPKPIKTGDKITITTPFKVKLPYTFSRGGHVEQAYQITQWYPKPAVYDREGWHPMPYLDQGEFFSEYGAFDVKITVPKNYIVAATGTLESTDENRFLNELATAKNPALDSFPESEKTRKTLQFTAQNVHDFAWFADKRFAVRKGEAVLKSGKKVETWAYFLKPEAKIWENATDYVSRAVEFYSEKVGEYEYPRAQAVRGALKAGGGMEYPMVTVIAATGNAKSLDNVIMHEVGHNWFYGMLGSNERDHGWMDEGFNTYIENRYMKKYYDKIDENTPKKPKKSGLIADFQNIDQADLVYKLQAGSRLDQACDTHSNSFSGINYYLGAYGKPGILLHYLEEYLGESLMDKAMHDYFTNWTGKHPLPADLKASFERSTNKNLDWFFKDLIQTNVKLDYAAKAVTKNGVLTVKNNTKTAAPFSVSAIKNGETVATEWYDGHVGTADIQPKGKLVNAAADRFIINNDGTMPELNRDNNEVKTSGMLPTCLPVAPKFLLGLDDPHKAEFYIAPALAWNNYDKTQLGLLFHSGVFPTATEWGIAPMYAFGSNQITGVAEIKHHFYPDNGGSLYRFTMGADAKRFTGYNAPNGDYMLQYWRASPFLQLEFAENGNSKLSHTITARSSFIGEQTANSYIEGKYAGKSNETRIVSDIKYELNNGRKLNPYNVQAQITQSADNGNEAFARINVSGEYTATYKKNGDGLTVRGFVGFFPTNANKKFGRFAYGFAQNGSTDLAYDQYYFGRTDNRESIWSQQVGTGGAGFKYPNGLSQQFGTSNALMAALNVKAALPFRLPLGIPLKPYFDAGYHQITAPSNLGANGLSNPEDELVYQGGLMLDFSKGAFNINFPLFNSPTLELALKSRNEGNYWKSVTFTIDVMKLNPRKIIKGLL